VASGGPAHAERRLYAFLELLASLAVAQTSIVFPPRMARAAQGILADLGGAIAFTYMTAAGREVNASALCPPLLSWAPRGPRRVVEVEEHGAPDWARRAAAERLQALTGPTAGPP
jgi:hypothetical protein